jgi:hypothetical protein
MQGEKIYEYDLDVTGVTDCGMSLEALLSGKEPVPPRGLRTAIAFDGRAQGRLVLSPDDVAVPHAAEPVADLCDNVTLGTAAREYLEVNARQVWGSEP